MSIPIIRKAIESDIPALLKLLQQVNQLHTDGFPHIFKSGGHKYEADDLNLLLKDTTTNIFVYDENESVLGYIFCMFEETKETSNLFPKKTLYIDDLCVDENARGKHIGTALFEYAKNFAVQSHCNRINLHVWSANLSAQKFYESMGMQELYKSMELNL